jgi:hypothetical protein
MSIRWITKVWSDSPYNGTRLLIHLALADISHDDGRFFASQKNLAEKGRCTVEYVRKVINEMIADGHIRIVSKGNSRGNATTYQLLIKKVPNTVGESLPIMDDELPNSDTPNSPTLEVQLPNATPHHPSYTSVLTTTGETAPAVYADGELAARTWWARLATKPIGKGAWHSLLEVCRAAEKQGYSADQIINALNYVGTVPSMRQMDLVLRGRGVKTAHEKSAERAIDLAQKLKDEST